MIYSDDDHELYVLADDPLTTAVRPIGDCRSAAEVDIHESRTDEFILLDIHAPKDAGRMFLCGFSERRATPDSQIAGFNFGLEHDDFLTRTSQREDRLFRNSWGILDARGRARVRIDRSLLRQLDPKQLWYSVVIQKSVSPMEICRVTTP